MSKTDLGPNSAQPKPDRRNVLLGGASLLAVMGASNSGAALAQQSPSKSHYGI
jgi:hypothetical protein